MIAQLNPRTGSCAVWWRLFCVLKFQITFLLEPVSKLWIRVHSKARFGSKAEHTR
jgi:hypothetical protein